MKKIFLAFPGFDPCVRDELATVGDLEVWNLKQMAPSEFRERIERHVSVINRSIRNDIFVSGDEVAFTKSYEASCWGILLPDLSEDNFTARYVSNVLMCLYAGTFPPITFYVSTLGLSVEMQAVHLGLSSQFHREDCKYLSKDFEYFYRTLFGPVAETQWNSMAVLGWSQEQWRLCMASALFMDLDKYQYSKSTMTWPKECAEIVTLYETLLSKKDHDYGAAFMLQRIEVLLGEHLGKGFAEQKESIRRLFGYRNDFIHGDFFRRLARKTKALDGSDIAELPTVEFDFLRVQTRLVRLVFGCILYLGTQLNKLTADDQSITSVQDAVERSVMDVALRGKIQELCRPILNAMAFGV